MCAGASTGRLLGAYWAPTESQSAWMPARELTAEDIAADVNRFREAPWGNRFEGILQNVRALDKYTVLVEFVDKFNLEGFYYMGREDRSLIAPPERIQAGDDSWENQVGTGPFQFEEYEMPFVDRFVTPIIPDQATQMAALPTARIDFRQFVPPSYWASLEGGNSQIASAKYSNMTYLVSMLQSEPPFDDVDVRKAFMIGTDIRAHRRLMFSEEIPRHSYPIHYQHPTYIPEEQLPEDIQELYDYDPEQARQIPADAGYRETPGPSFRSMETRAPIRYSGRMYKPVKATVGAVIEGPAGVLLALRNHPPFEGFWCLPGGHIEFGEKVEDALRREIEEETGLSVVNHRFLGYFDEYFPELDWHAVALMFVVQAKGTAARQESEVRQLRWFTSDELSGMELAFAHGEVIRRYLSQ